MRRNATAPPSARTVAGMSTARTPIPEGLTPDAGWELDVERVLSLPLDDAWQRLISEWLPVWLGSGSVPQMVGAPLHDLRGRLRGRVVGCHVGRRVRVRWTPADLDHEVIFQVSLTPAAGGTTVQIHQERLLGPAERQGRVERWTQELEQLVRSIAKETGAIPVVEGTEEREER